MEVSFFKSISTRLFGLLFIFISLSAFAQKPHFQDKKTANNIQQHIEYLANEELEGRKMASSGEFKAATYIANQFKEIGLEPKGTNGYLQEIIVPNLRMAQANTSLFLDGKVQTLFTDFYPISESANNGLIKGDAINIGYGIVDAGLKHNDYKDLEVKGKVVMIDLDIPGGTNEHNRYMSWAGTELRITTAKSKGAKAIIFYSTDKELAPSGTLANVLTNSGIPILFSKNDLSASKEVPVELNIDVLLLSTTAQNVVGFINNDAQFTVVIGTHHDHIGMGDDGSTIHRGVDEASGPAATIELARRIMRKRKKFSNYNYVFVSFTGNKQDMSGSKYFFDNEIVLVENINYMLNIDKIGQLDSTHKTLYASGMTTGNEWQADQSNISKRKISSVKWSDTLALNSDHKYFYVNYSPVLSVTTSYTLSASDSDEQAEAINYGGAAFTTRYLYKVICSLDKKEKTVFTKTILKSQPK